jgi:hypothetical protein
MHKTMSDWKKMAEDVMEQVHLACEEKAKASKTVDMGKPVSSIFGLVYCVTHV